MTTYTTMHTLPCTHCAQDLEAQRIAASSEALQEAGGAYASVLGPLAAQAAGLQPALADAGSGGHELAELVRVAEAADSAARALAAKQAESIEGVCQVGCATARAVAGCCAVGQGEQGRMSARACAQRR